MSGPQEIHSRSEILAALQESEAELVVFFSELSPALMFGSKNGKWSPDQHVRHLTLTLSRVRQGLAAQHSKLAGALPESPAGRSYTQLRTNYRAALAAGGQAPSAFAPLALPQEQCSAAQQATDIRDFETASQQLCQELSNLLWTEQALDALTLPHPLLGQLSVREMLMHIVYHNLHHLAGVQSTLEQA